MSHSQTLPSQTPVLIVGAGPTGLSLAIELVRRNVECLLIDRNPAPLPFDRATVIHSRSLECFETMGTIDEFLARGHIMRGFNIFAFGKKVAQTSFESLECRHPYDLNLAENETEEILTARLESLGGRVSRGWSLEGLNQTDTEVTATLKSAQGVETTVTANWLVGTDGIHSRVRESIGVSVAGHQYPARWGVVDGYLPDWQHEPDRAAIQIDAPALNPVPMPGNRWRIYFRVFDETQTDNLLEQINAGLASISPGTCLQDPDQPMLYHTFRQLSAHYRSSRVLLAGDAAHACSPIEGHGMNTGIQDSFNLGWKLAHVIRGEAGDGLLNSYELERRPIANAVGASGDVAEELRTIPDEPAAVERVKRALCAMLLPARGQLQAAEAETEISFHYRDSPLVRGYHTAGATAQQNWLGPRPGDCLPEAGPLLNTATGDTLSLFQLLNTTGNLLFWFAAETFEIPATAEIESVLQPEDVCYIITTVPPAQIPVSATPRVHWLSDSAGSVHARLGVIDPTLFIVRPDGHIALRCEPPQLEQVTAYYELLQT
ncbi:FAD-dependent monooxygenase [Gimesia chilikensis]|uniref:FAD-dependent monooxygenase n=1 Tax=Gimesia chilikensis TaxID=2605989 RepID=UPI00118B6DA9|nr:FAD-dependent monooxygenase [Gimesia chilikensis]QDT86012.1 Pentachlorophenol 4-monooxygenase [Gimesia chilikensis]